MVFLKKLQEIQNFMQQYIFSKSNSLILYIHFFILNLCISQTQRHTDTQRRRHTDTQTHRHKDIFGSCAFNDSGLGLGELNDPLILPL